MMRLLATLLLAACCLAPLAGPARADPFGACGVALHQAALAGGITPAGYAAAMAGVTPEPRILAATGRQSEFQAPLWDYLSAATTPARVARGRRLAAEHRATLSAIERRYGVDAAAVMGVWGMESNFGSSTGGIYVVRALATLACGPVRPDYFREQFIDALAILQHGHVTREAMRGSWAGAMGQTQFMPSSFLRYAVDFDGDGRKDIWTDVPDALASTASFLKGHGWIAGQPWGFEVALPKGFDMKPHGRSIDAPFARWKSLGVTRRDGRPMPPTGKAALWLPAGIGGPAFLITPNFMVIKAYNTSDSYSLGVALLGDRILGGAGVVTPWPRKAPRLAPAERVELQQRLVALGYDVGKPDGRFGEKTVEAVRRFQLSAGLVPDGYADPAVLAALRRGR